MRVNVAGLCESKLNKIKKDTLQFVIDPRKANDWQQKQVHRAFTFNSFLRLAFEYGADIKYYAHSKVEIGTMDNRNVRIVMRLSSKMGQLVNFTRQKKCIYTYTH